MTRNICLILEADSWTSKLMAARQFGVIALDEIKICQLQLKWLRQQMGVVSLEPVLFNDNIRANIAYGKGGNSTEAEIKVASKLANC
ncbi:hypothetical protein RYX36_035067 [Vicia faba]